MHDNPPSHTSRQKLERQLMGLLGGKDGDSYKIRCAPPRIDERRGGYG